MDWGIMIAVAVLLACIHSNCIQMDTVHLTYGIVGGAR